MKNPDSDNNPGNDGVTVVAIPEEAERPTAEYPTERQPLELPSHDVLAQLAHDDPAAYEALRREVVEGFIDGAPERLKARLNGIQFQVDSVRRLSRASALGATVRIYKLMWKSFQQLNEVWQNFVPLDERINQPDVTSTTKYAPENNARILEFKPRLPCDQ